MKSSLKNKHYDVSLIIPIYNVAEFVEESLLSALNQSYDSIEYIIIDDKGTDNSMVIVRETIANHYRKDDVFIIEHSENGGLSAARNTGIENATGDYVFFMDSDDEIVPDCIKSHYSASLKNNADFTVANFELVGYKSIQIKNNMLREKARDEIIKSFLCNEWTDSACNKLYKKSFLEEYKLSFVCGLTHEDKIWSYLVSLNATKMAVVNEKTYLYKIRDNSITTATNSSKKIESLIFIISEIGKSADNLPDLFQQHSQYITSLRFITSLTLLSSRLNFDDRKKYYRKINSIEHKKRDMINIYSVALKLPFVLFFVIFKIPYTIYKKR